MNTYWRLQGLCNAAVLVLYVAGVLTGPLFLINLFILSGVLGYEFHMLQTRLTTKTQQAISVQPIEPDDLCKVGPTRDYEQRLVDAGVMTEDEMSICDGEYCRECRDIKQRRDYVESTKEKQMLNMREANNPRTFFDDFYYDRHDIMSDQNNKPVSTFVSCSHRRVGYVMGASGGYQARCTDCGKTFG